MIYDEIYIGFSYLNQILYNIKILTSFLVIAWNPRHANQRRGKRNHHIMHIPIKHIHALVWWYIEFFYKKFNNLGLVAQTCIAERFYCEIWGIYDVFKKKVL